MSEMRLMSIHYWGAREHRFSSQNGFTTSAEPLRYRGRSEPQLLNDTQLSRNGVPGDSVTGHLGQTALGGPSRGEVVSFSFLLLRDLVHMLFDEQPGK